MKQLFTFFRSNLVNTALVLTLLVLSAGFVGQQRQITTLRKELQFQDAAIGELEHEADGIENDLDQALDKIDALEDKVDELEYGSYEEEDSVRRTLIGQRIM